MDQAKLQTHWLEAVTFLRAADDRLGALIQQHQFDSLKAAPEPSPYQSHFIALIRTIIGQQLSVKVADTMEKRFLSRYGDQENITPAAILTDDIQELRQAVGLSNAKARSIVSLAHSIENDGFQVDQLDELSDDALISTLIQLRGIGEWTAHIFAMFQLQRPDILAASDLGIRKAVERVYDLAELPTREEVEALGERWSPYRTTACRILWRSLEVIR